MLCPKCGNIVDEEAKVCATCGAPLAEESAAPEAPAQPTEQIEEKPAEAAEETAPSGGIDSFYGASSEQKEPEKEETKKKKGKKGLIALIASLLAVAVVAIVAVVNWRGIKNWWLNTFSSPENQLCSVAKQGTDDALKAYTEAIPVSMTAAGGTSECTFTFTLSPEMKGPLQLLTGVDLSWLKDAAVDVKLVREEDDFSGDLALKLNDVEILTGDFYLNLEDMSLHARLDQISEEYFQMDLNGLMDQLKENAGKDLPSLELLKSLLKADYRNQAAAYRKLAVRYVGVALDALEKGSVDRKKGEGLTAGDVTEKGTLLTVKLDAAQLKNVVRAVLEEAREDKELYELVKSTMEGLSDITLPYVLEDKTSSYGSGLSNAGSLLSPLGEENELTWENYTKPIDEALDNLDSMNLGDESAELSLFVASGGEIHGITAQVGEATFTYAFPRSGGKFAFLYTVENEGETLIKAIGSGKEKNGVITGDIDVFVEEEKIVTFSCEDFNVKKLKEGAFVGKITVMPDAALMKKLIEELAGGKELGIPTVLLEKIALVIESDSDSTGGTAKISLAVSGNELFSIAEKALFKKGGSANVVSGGMDVSSYGSEENLKKARQAILEQLLKAGVPASLLSKLSA